MFCWKCVEEMKNELEDFQVADDVIIRDSAILTCESCLKKTNVLYITD